MTAEEWKRTLGENIQIGVCGGLYHDLAACEHARDEALYDVKQLHDAAVETEDLEEKA